MQVALDEGAALGEAVQIVRLRQFVRLYKFFIEPMQLLSILPSWCCAPMPIF